MWDFILHCLKSISNYKRMQTIFKCFASVFLYVVCVPIQPFRVSSVVPGGGFVAIHITSHAAVPHCY